MDFFLGWFFCTRLETDIICLMEKPRIVTRWDGLQKVVTFLVQPCVIWLLGYLPEENTAIIYRSLWITTLIYYLFALFLWLKGWKTLQKVAALTAQLMMICFLSSLSDLEEVRHTVWIATIYYLYQIYRCWNGSE